MQYYKDIRRWNNEDRHQKVRKIPALFLYSVDFFSCWIQPIFATMGDIVVGSDDFNAVYITDGIGEEDCD